MLVKKIMWMMLSAMIMAVVMVVLITAWTAQKNNERAAADSLQMVRGGYFAEIQKLEALNYDYSAWTAAMEAAVAKDVDWLYENMGSAAIGAPFHILEIFWPQDWASLTWNPDIVENESAPLTTPLLSVETVQAIQEMMRPVELGEQDTQNFAFSKDGKFYLVAASRLQPWGQASPVPADELPINIMAQELTRDVLSELEAIFLIEDLTLSTQMPTTDLPSVPLLGPNGEPIAHLKWTPPRPGDALIQIAAIPIAAGLLVFLTLSGAVTVMARRNASELVVREVEASIAARVDVLTGLPNRMAFNENFARLRKQDVKFALLLMDLNGFKAINDEFGHKIGDELLRSIAKIATQCLREQDTIARLGGDEFSIMFTGEYAEAACIKFCNDLTHQMVNSIKVNDLVFQPKIAMGYTIGRSTEANASELMHEADFAMYAAKNAKLSEPLKYDKLLEEDKIKELEIQHALEGALREKTEFSVAYQPIVDAKTGELKLVEALVRWNSTTLGNVPPDAFISIAEKTGMIVELGRLIIDNVFKDMEEFPELKVSINLSPVQLRSRSILNDIQCMAKAHRVNPRLVTFEVTESMLVDDPELTAFILDCLSDQGYGIAIDDFGTGFSSIGYLRKFHFDKLKIDKSFVDDIGVAENSGNLMKALVFLSRSLNMEIVAEGVETEEQCEMLKDVDYDLLQGYFFSRPLPFSDLKDYIAENSLNFQSFQKLQRSA